MPRPSKREESTLVVREYCALAEVHSPEQYPLDIKSVADKTQLSRTTIYKYDLDEEINAAAKRQRANQKKTGKDREQLDATTTILRLRADMKRLQEHNDNLVAQICIMEGNMARLGIDPEELYKPLSKPNRMVSKAGRSNPKGRKWG